MNCCRAVPKMSMSSKLGRDFYLQPTLVVAKALIGKEFIFSRGGATLSRVELSKPRPISEKTIRPAMRVIGLTKRNAIMYGVGGFTYVYFVYGMYNMLNFVTERAGFSRGSADSRARTAGRHSDHESASWCERHAAVDIRPREAMSGIWTLRSKILASI